MDGTTRLAGSLAKIIYQEAEDNGWPGLGKDVRQICLNIGIPDLNVHYMRKSYIKNAILKSHYDDMISQFDESKKLQDIKNDNFMEVQEYFNDKNIESAILKFKIRTKMVENIPGNFKNKLKNIKNGLKCNYCEDDMTQEHCKICPGRSDIREGLNMSNINDLVIYFGRVMSEKAKKSGPGTSSHWAG